MSRFFKNSCPRPTRSLELKSRLRPRMAYVREEQPSCPVGAQSARNLIFFYCHHWVSNLVVFNLFSSVQGAFRRRQVQMCTTWASGEVGAATGPGFQLLLSQLSDIGRTLGRRSITVWLTRRRVVPRTSRGAGVWARPWLSSWLVGPSISSLKLAWQFDKFDKHLSDKPVCKAYRSTGQAHLWT